MVRNVRMTPPAQQRRPNGGIFEGGNFVDPATGNPTQVPTPKELRALIDQNLALQGKVPASVPNMRQRPGAPPIEVPQAPIRTNKPGITQRVVTRSAGVAPNALLEDLGDALPVDEDMPPDDEMDTLPPEPDSPDLPQGVVRGRRGDTVIIDGKEYAIQKPRDPNRKILTNAGANAGAPSAPPFINPIQYVARTKPNPGEVQRDENAPGPVQTGKPRLVTKPLNRKGPLKYERIALLTGFTFYPWKDCQIRKIGIADQIQIERAQAQNDLTLFIDAIGETLTEDVDVRDLTLPDFYFILYWHRFNSYASVPFVVPWNSKYGHPNTYTITSTSLKYNPPKISEEDYAAWQDLGFAVPTIRDLEIFSRENLEGEDLWIFERAQYFKGKPNEQGVIDIQEKINAMHEICGEDVNALGMIPDFQKDINHSITEEIEVTDAKFDPKEWATSRLDIAKALKDEANLVVESDPVRFLSLTTYAEELEQEGNTILSTLEQGGQVLPEVEKIVLNIRPLDFFPRL